MAIQTEVWVQDIQEVLFSGKNEFLRMSINHDVFVQDKKVHVPQAGSIPAAEKNRSVVPATISERTDTDLEYELDEYTTDPILVRDIDEIQVSFRKRESIMKQHINVLMDRMALEGIFNWSSNTLVNQVKTTGSLVTDNLPPSATGSRRRLTVVDIKNLAKTMDNQNVPDEGRKLLLPSDMYYEIFTINDLIKADIAGALTLPKAVANKILGFDVIKRSKTLLYDNGGTGTKKAVGAAAANDDNFGGLAWQEDFVATAMGEIKVFSDVGQATVYGDIMSAMVLSRSTQLRTDQAGIVNLIQASS